MRSLIIGHTGQDGRILWDQLVHEGHSVIGISRSEIRNHPKTMKLGTKGVEQVNLHRLIAKFRPHYVYYLAACHHSSQDKFADERDIASLSWQTHVHSFEAVLDSLKLLTPETKVFYASSSRIFGATEVSPQNEETPWSPTCIYGTTKAAGMLVAGYYRRVHGMHVSCGILYNHESPLRGAQFVSQRIIKGLVAIKRGKKKSLEIGNLSARVDWGYAPDYTKAMSMMVKRDHASDRIIATGKLHSVRDLVMKAAGVLNLPWQDVIVEKAGILQRSSQELRGDASLLRSETGWKPQISFDQMIKIMVESAIKNEC